MMVHAYNPGTLDGKFKFSLSNPISNNQKKKNAKDIVQGRGLRCNLQYQNKTKPRMSVLTACDPRFQPTTSHNGRSCIRKAVGGPESNVVEIQ